jgi:long-chain acyl-CoA synthetase
MDWRVIHNNEGEVADLMGFPGAVSEVRVARRYILDEQSTPETIIFHKVKRKGMLAGAEVVIDREKAEEKGIEIAIQSKSERDGIRPSETISFQELMLKAKDQFTSVDSSPDEMAALIYTSGTIGNPKGVMLTHENFLSECEATSEIITTTEEDRFASLVPFFHIYGLAIGLVTPLFRGCCTFLIPQYSPRHFLQKVDEEEVSILIAIPAQYHHLVLAAKRRPLPKKHLRYCISGAAPVPVHVIDSFKEAFGIDIMEGYGLTETTSAVAVNPEGKTKPGSVGLPVKGVQIKIVDKHGNIVSPNKTGEITVKGKVVMKGYYNLPEEAKEFLPDGWLCTGDIGYQDEEGYLYITDRKKDIIIKGGFNISPAEIETLLMLHPKVKEAAVVGEKEKEGREEAIKVFIVPNEGVLLTAGEIIDCCRAKLAPYKVPDGVEFRGSLPKSVTGKILRKELRQGYKDISVIGKK